MANQLFIPTEIPWKDLKGKELEELLYWLFDSMGGKELEWRIGGSGAGTSDQGRDIELSFYVSSPDGELIKQKWWVEAKGRTGTVEPTEVKSAVINAAGKSTIDILVIATNTNFSNPTRDWVKEWQGEHKRPIIKLWEKTELETHCSKNPLAVIRLFAKALTPNGKLAVAASKLWDYAYFTDEPTLNNLWKDRESLEFDERGLIALIASEVANGDIRLRSWGMVVKPDLLLETLAYGLVNCLYLLSRAGEAGTKMQPIFRCLSYFVLICNHRIGPEVTSSILTNIWNLVEGRTYPEEAKTLILQPIMSFLHNEIRDVCISDCPRIITDRLLLSEDEVDSYWDRFRTADKVSEDRKHILTLEKGSEPCKVGFALDQDHDCPLCQNDCPENNIGKTLQDLKMVTKFRGGSANEQD